MKIDRAIKDKHEELDLEYKDLHCEVEPILKRIIKGKGWFLNSRLKKVEGFTLKLESDKRYGKGNKFEDFLGYEIVVNTKDEISNAITEITQANIMIEYQRPKSLDEVFQAPEDFRFNEVRLYVKRPTPQGARPKNIHNLVFEIQIKTVLSYAWGKATHDIIYKASKFSWGKSRVAFQIKAILEQAEFAISQIEMTDESYYPVSTQFEEMNNIASWLEKKWAERLPSNLKRLAELIFNLCKELQIDVQDLISDLDTEAQQDRGYKLVNLSPYLAIFQSLINTRPNDFLKLDWKSKVSFINVDTLIIPSNIEAHLKTHKLLKSIKIQGSR